MQPVEVVPGLALERETALAPLSLSPSETVPAVNVFEGLLVVLDRAENVPAPATVPATPSTTADASSLRARVTGSPPRRARAASRGSDPRSRPAPSRRGCRPPRRSAARRRAGRPARSRPAADDGREGAPGTPREEPAAPHGPPTGRSYSTCALDERRRRLARAASRAAALAR